MKQRSQPSGQPGSAGEHVLQQTYGTRAPAASFYRNQVLEQLNLVMQEFIARQEMVFIATADAGGECDCSFRAGRPGFVRVLDERTMAYPEYRGNGVLASLGNISENAHVGMLFLDFFDSPIGLHVNGRARIAENEELLERPGLPKQVREDIDVRDGPRPERWVLVEVEEAYIHCSKHVPRLEKQDKTIHWGTDDSRQKGEDYFRAKRRDRASDRAQNS